MPPTVSVLLPVYNGERFLSQAVESVLAQTYSDFELLVCDDGSKDSTRRIIENYTSKDGRVRYWLNSERGGPFANYNRCLERAQAPIVKLMAQDDLLGPRMLEAVVDIFERHSDVVLVSTGKNCIDHEGQSVSGRDSGPAAGSYVVCNRALPGMEVVLKSILPAVNFVGEPTTVAFRKAFSGEGFDSCFYHLGDLEYWLRILLNGKYFYLSGKHCSFRVHDLSLSSANNRNLLFAVDILRLGHKLRFLFEPAGISEKEYSEAALELIAGEVRRRVAEEKLSLGDIRSNNRLAESKCEEDDRADRKLLDDLLLLQELAFHAFMTDSLHSSPLPENQAADKVLKRNEKLIAVRERKLRTLMESGPWRMTRLVRDWRKMLSRRPVTAGGGTPAAKIIYSDRVDRIDSQRAYLAYLRAQIRAIMGSRSWQLGRALRGKSASGAGAGR